jgi:hypothetical protein
MDSNDNYENNTGKSISEQIPTRTGLIPISVEAVLDSRLYSSSIYNDKSYGCNTIELQCLNAAYELGIFQLIEHDFVLVKEIADKLQIKSDLRRFIDFLDVLYNFKHLARKNVGINASYKLINKDYMSSNKENKINQHQFLLRWMRNSFTLIEKLRDGSSNEKKFDENIYDKDEKSFMKYMNVLHKKTFKKIAKEVDFSMYKTFLDVGGCLGNFCITVRKKHPHLEFTCLDLKRVEKYFNEELQERKIEKGIKFFGGDMFKDDFPKSDVITMGWILHDWNEEVKKSLFAKVFKALNDEGIFIIAEYFIEEERDKASVALLGSVCMIFECNDGFNNTFSEISAYALEAGFTNVELKKDGTEEYAICRKGKN